MRNINHYRQGDVALVKISKPTVKLEEINVKGRVILAYGEATGHHHSINVLERPDIKFYKVKEQEQTHMLFIPDLPATLEHQEHGAIVLEPGWYQIENQVEYDPEGERRVAD